MKPGVRIVREQSLSRRLPPPDAWREPGKWLDPHTGLLLKHMRGRLRYPSDERGLAQPDIAFAEYRALLWDDYFPTIDQTDPELKTDNHHLYYPRASYKPQVNGDSLIPFLFREQSANLIEIHRPDHNGQHDIFGAPQKPAQRVMMEELEENYSARQIMQLAVYVATHTVEFQQLFNARRSDIALHPDRIGHRDYDEIGEEFLRRKFDARHSHLKDVLGQLEDSPYFTKFFPDASILRKRPAVVAAKLGEAVARRSVYYVERSFAPAA